MHGRGFRREFICGEGDGIQTVFAGEFLLIKILKLYGSG